MSTLAGVKSMTGEKMTITKACLTASLLILFPAGLAIADQNDSRLDELFLIFQQTDNPEVVNNAETEIWQIWLQHDNKQTQERLAEGVAAMNRNPHKAFVIFNELIAEVPDFAEAWNKRATLYYMVGEYAASASDIERTLELEPRHFGALSGLGLVFLAQDQPVRAKSAFEAVLLLHPHSSAARRNIESIDDHLRRDAI